MRGKKPPKTINQGVKIQRIMEASKADKVEPWESQVHIPDAASSMSS